jgi:predicted amidophosphoribosyltransferase
MLKRLLDEPSNNMSGGQPMKCPNCQTMNPPAAKFCVECGKAFDIHCPKCGTVTPAGGKFCMSCGHNLQRTPKSETIDYSQPQTYTPKYLAEKILTTPEAPSKASASW